jgi:peptidoglycan hydrolase CwlO-like protein
MTTELFAIIGVGVSLGLFGLANLQVMNKRFDDVNRRFDDVNKRFDDVNKRIDDTNGRFDDTNRRIDQLASNVKQVETRVTELEKGQARMEGMLNGLREALFARSREVAGSNTG